MPNVLKAKNNFVFFNKKNWWKGSLAEICLVKNATFSSAWIAFLVESMFDRKFDLLKRPPQGKYFSSKKCFIKSKKKKPPQVPAGKRPEGRGCSQQRGSAPVYLDNSDNLNTFLPFDNRLFFKQRFCDHISVFLKMGLKTFNVLIDKEDINNFFYENGF